MATVNGITAEYAQEILDQTIETAVISGATLVFHRTDGSTFSAGDFQTYIDDKVALALSSSVAAAVASAVPPAVVGGLTAKGNVAGTVSFTGISAAQLVNRLITLTLSGNITVDSASFPASPLAGTQFAMVMKQDAVGSRLLTLTGIKKSTGSLVLSTAPNAIDIIVFMFDGTNWYAGALGVAFA